MKNVLLFFSIVVLFLGAASAQENNPKFSGYMFGDYFYNANAIDSAMKDINGFNFRRIYITTDYSISDQFSTRFRMESAISNGSNISVIVKDAWLKWQNIFSGSDLVVGISPTPAYDVSEGAWGYRSLEKTIMDYFGIVSSRDMGIDLKGKLDENGIAKYWVKIGNGSGNKPETNKYKRYYALLQFTPGSDFMFTLYGDYNTLPKVEDKDNSAFVAAGFINYKHDKAFSLGIEGFIKNQQNAYTAPGAESPETKNGFGISFWAKALLSDNIGIVGRYDTYDPNTNSAAKNDKQGLIIGAVDFKVAPKVSVMPGIEVHTLEGADNSDVTPRVTFYWKF